MRKPTNGNGSNSIKTNRKELLSKKAELLTSLGFNFKKLADAERNSEDDLIVALQDESWIGYSPVSSEKWNLR